MKNRTALQTAVAAALLLGSATAMADGRLEGRVVAADQSTALEGASVRIESLDRTVTTQRDGRFSFGQLPAGSYSVTVSYLGAPSETQSVIIAEDTTASVDITLGRSMDEIVVHGVRGGNARALNLQRNSNTFVSIVSADAIGQLPDQNVAEAVQRVPGVFVERDQGEGRFIGIRGIDPNLNLTTINGLFVPSPESGARSVALDVIPADLVGSLEISKSVTPDMDASTIGGTVNIRSLSAFDHDGRSLTLSAEGSHNGLVESTSPKIGGSYTDLFDIGGGEKNLGVALAASWFDREFGSDNIETDGGWPNDLETVGGGEFKGAEEIEQRSYDVTRERIGLAANFDLRTDNGEYYLRNLYSDFSDQEYRTRNEWKFDDGGAISGSSTSAQWDGATVEKSIKDRLEEQTILSVLAGGENYVGDWTIDYSYGYSYSEEKEPARLDTEFELEDLSLGYTAVGERPNLVPDPAMLEASNFTIKEWVALDGNADDTTNTLKLNFTNDLFNSGYSGNIRFGALARTREKTFAGDTTVYEGPDGLTAAQFAASAPRYGINEFGPGLDAGAVRQYFLANRSTLDVDADGTLVDSTVDDYSLNEDVVAAYLMSAYEKEDLTVVFGVRYEDTSFDATGARIAIDDVAGSGDPEVRPVTFDNSYDHVLPSINVRWELGDVVLRGAATQSIARPNFDELKPGGEIEFETDGGENELSAQTGNPLLEPIEATNLDVGIEWYPGGVSVMSAGVFYKKLDHFIVYADVADSIDLTQFVGNTPVDDAEVIQPINGDEAELLGVELNVLRQFENGLYVSANGTFVDSEATYFGRTEKTVMPRTPETVLNGAIGWENTDLSLRLAATYRDDALIGLDELDDPDFDVYQDKHLQLDLSATWNVTPELQLALSAVNLTDEPYYAYFGSRAYNAQFEEYGRTFSVGLRYRPY